MSACCRRPLEPSTFLRFPSLDPPLSRTLSWQTSPRSSPTRCAPPHSPQIQPTFLKGDGNFSARWIEAAVATRINIFFSLPPSLFLFLFLFPSFPLLLLRTFLSLFLSLSFFHFLSFFLSFHPSLPLTRSSTISILPSHCAPAKQYSSI
jgi:hypothetical protein